MTWEELKKTKLSINDLRILVRLRRFFRANPLIQAIRVDVIVQTRHEKDMWSITEWASGDIYIKPTDLGLWWLRQQNRLDALYFARIRHLTEIWLDFAKLEYTLPGPYSKEVLDLFKGKSLARDLLIKRTVYQLIYMVKDKGSTLAPLVLTITRELEIDFVQS